MRSASPSSASTSTRTLGTKSTVYSAPRYTSVWPRWRPNPRTSETGRTFANTTLGAASGAVAGLVAITPCSGFVGGTSPIWIGFLAGGLCFLAIQLKFRFGYDDSLDVVGVHLAGGVIGSLLLGLFADANVNPAGKDGLFFGGGVHLLVQQVIAVASVLVFSFAVSWVIAKVVDATVGLRCTPDDELEGLDLTQHAEAAYAFGELGSIGRI